MSELLPAHIAPGLVPTGFAESVLERAQQIDDPADLWDGATTLAGYAQKWNGHGREKNEIKTAQMYCEVVLGQRLGPPIGSWAHTTERDYRGRISPDPHADLEEELPIPAQRVAELRRYFRHRDYLIELVREGYRSRRRLLLAIDRLEAKSREAPEREDLDIRSGDFRDVLGDLEPASVALVLTDPPYPAEYVELWGDLGNFATKALVDGGSLIAYCGQSVLPDALDRLRLHLRYWWIIALNHSSGTQMLPGKFVSVGWKPLLWFVRDKRLNKAFVPDRVNGTAPRKSQDVGDDGMWAQGVDELEPIISALTAPGDLIVDPFAGSGSTGVAATRFGRRFIGAEVTS